MVCQINDFIYLGSTDRQTKVAACELLHSTLLFMIGTNATQQKQSDFTKLYEHLFPGPLYSSLTAHFLSSNY
jgi:hypothetical protein